MGGGQSKQAPSTTLVADTSDTTLVEGGHATTALTLNAEPNATLQTMSIKKGMLSGKEVDYDVVGKISDYDPRFTLLNRHAAASAKRAGAEQIRNNTITKKLLLAVANGMESREVNINSLTGNLFKDDQRLVTEESMSQIKEARVHNEVLSKEQQVIVAVMETLLTEDILKKSPEFLLERGGVTDSGGRTFKNVTAFEYALWAKDFKMLKMMLRCVPKTEEGNRIRAELAKQYEQVTAPVYAGGGLTYDLIYEQPNLDATNGIPTKNAAGNWQTTPVTETRTESHFDVTSLLKAYIAYGTNFYSNVDSSSRTWSQRNAYWVKIIGTFQRLLPVHMLQRYLAPDTPFDPLPTFTGVFKRTMQFYNYFQASVDSLFSSSLSSDYALLRCDLNGGQLSVLGSVATVSTKLVTTWLAATDLAAVRQLDEVSTNEVEKIKQQLTTLGAIPTKFRH